MTDYLKAIELSLDKAREAIVKNKWGNVLPQSNYDYLMELQRRMMSMENPTTTEMEYCLAWIQCCVYINSDGFIPTDDLIRINKLCAR